jgi:hypothetical protein
MAKGAKLDTATKRAREKLGAILNLLVHAKQSPRTLKFNCLD